MSSREAQIRGHFGKCVLTPAGYLGFFQFLRNFYQLTAFEQAEMILYAALDPAIASKARRSIYQHL